MAEGQRETTGQVLSRIGGVGTRGDPNMQAIAAAVQSGGLSREDTRKLTSFQLAKLGTSAYRDLYPDTYGIRGGLQPSLISGDAIELAALRELRAGLTGLGNYYYRKLVDTRIAGLRKRMGANYADIGFDIPEWMKPLISEGRPYETGEDVLPQKSSGRGMGRGYGREKELPEGAGQLVPLGAQTELSVDQQRFMQGYLGWGRAGFATRLRGDAPSKIKGMVANQQAGWAEYVRRSQSMFPPDVRLGVNKRIASQ
jgi:hypothetical protein